MAQLSRRHILQTLEHEAKQVLRENDLAPSTRRSNKELAFTLKRLAQNPYDSLDEVSKAGREVGEAIVKLSKERGKQHLDGGVLKLMGPGAIASKTTPDSTAKTSKSPTESPPPAAAPSDSQPAASPAATVEAGSDLANQGEPTPPETVDDVEVAEDAKTEAQSDAESQAEALVEPEPEPELSEQPAPKAAAEPISEQPAEAEAALAAAAKAVDSDTEEAPQASS